MGAGDAPSPVRVDVLGPLRLVVGGTAVDVPGPKRRAVLALAEGRIVTIDHLVDALWPSEVPESGRQALHTHISRLRTHLGPAAARLQTRQDGYRLDLVAGDLDVAHARSLVERARAVAGEDAAGACVLLREVGPVLADLTHIAPIATAVEGCRPAAPGGDRRTARLRDRRGTGPRGSRAGRNRLRRRPAARTRRRVADACAGHDGAGTRGAAHRPRVPAPTGRGRPASTRHRRWANSSASSRPAPQVRRARQPVEAMLRLARGAYGEVIEHSLAAAAIATAPRESLGIAALAAAYAGDPGRARTLNDQGLDCAVSPTMLAWGAYVVGEIESSSGRRESAEQHYVRAIDLARTSGATFLVGVATVGLLAVRAHAGRVDDALRGYRDVIGYFARTSNWTHLWTTLRNLADLLRRLGDDGPATLIATAADNAPDAPAVDHSRAPDPPAALIPGAPLPSRADVLEVARQVIERNLKRPRSPGSR